MNRFQIKIIERFSQENLEKCFPSYYFHLNLVDGVQRSKQPVNSAIVGVFKEMKKRRTPMRSGPVMRLTLNEVEGGKPGTPFEVIIYEKYVPLVDELLHKAGEAIPWVIFYDTYFNNFSGVANRCWASITPNIDIKENYNPGITFVLQKCDLDKSNLSDEEIQQLIKSSETEDSKSPVCHAGVAVRMTPKTKSSHKTTQKKSLKLITKTCVPSSSEPSTSSAEFITSDESVTRDSSINVDQEDQERINVQKTSSARKTFLLNSPKNLVTPKQTTSKNSAPEPSTSSLAKSLPTAAATKGDITPNPDDQIPVMKVNLNSVTDGGFYTVFVVVKEVIKQTSLLPNGSRHTILLLVDPSCLDPNARRQDLLLHIFFNDGREGFKSSIEQFDVLKLENMKGDFYRKENKIHGKILFSHSLVQFKFKNSDVIPVTTNVNYIFTDYDKRCALYIRNWWQEVHIPKVTAEAEPPLKTIEAVEGSSLFNISCLITDVREHNESAEVILRIKDGTLAVIHTAPFDFDEMSRKWTAIMSEASFGVSEIEISVFNLLQQEANRLQVGDFVFLSHVSCFECERTRTTTTRVFAFRMESVEATIAKVLLQGSRAQRIKRAIEDNRGKERSPKRRR